jgi:hypothetical protein
MTSFHYAFLPLGLGIPPTQLSKYGNLGHVNISVIQEPLAFILPKREMAFSLDDQELMPELAAPAPELPAEEPSLEPAAAAAPEEREPGEPQRAEPPSEGP